MNAIGTALNVFWNDRNPRERMLLGVAGLVLGVVILYGLLWAPAETGRARLREQLPVMQRQLAQMTEQANEARALASQANSVTPTGGALRDALAASLEAAGLNAAQLTITGSGVRVELGNVSFAAWVGWLDQVRKQYKVQVAEAHVTAHPRAPQIQGAAPAEQGQVDLTVTLQPPAAGS